MDFRSHRLRTGLLLGTVFVAGVAVGPASGLIGRHFGYDFGITAALAQDSSNRADTYRLLTLFGDVFERVRAEYVDPVDRQGPGRECHQRHADGPRSALQLHEREAVPRHAGADQGRVRRPRHRGHAGERLHQGDQPDRRHAGGEGRGQGRRHHHRARRQDGAGPVAARRGRSDARRCRTRRSR